MGSYAVILAPFRYLAAPIQSICNLNFARLNDQEKDSEAGQNPPDEQLAIQSDRMECGFTMH